MKAFTLQELARLTGGRIIGDPRTKITHAAPIEQAGEGAISFLANPKYARYLESTRAFAVIVSPQVSRAPVALLQVQNPYAAFAKVLARLHPPSRPAAGIHPSAVIAEDVRLGADIYIGPQVVLERGCEIGDRTYIHAGSCIGENCRIGADCLLYANVTIYREVQIGNKVSIHSGSVIGSDGFGYVFAEGKQQKVPQVGTVIIEDGVEIGANVTIDRGTLGATRIAGNVKIDNLVQIAHNVLIGENSIIVAQAGISGSTKLGKRVILGGKAGVVGHIELADDTKVAANTGVTKSTAPGAILAGFAGIPHQEWRKSQAALRRLPRLLEKIRRLEKEIKRREKS